MNHARDLARGGLTLDTIHAEVGGVKPHDLIADTLAMHPGAIKDLLRAIAQNSRQCTDPTLIAAQIGMAFGARQARANADNERLAA